MAGGVLGAAPPGLEPVLCALAILALCAAYWRERRLRHGLARGAAALADSERFNRTLFEVAPIGLALCEMDGRILDCNPAYAEIVGRSPAEARGLSVWDITPAEYLEAGYQNVHAIATEGRFGPFEKAYLRPDGESVQVRLSGRAIERRGERCFLVTVEDIGLEKAARAELEALVAERTSTVRRSEAWLSAVIEHSPVGICFSDAAGRLTYANRSVLDTLPPAAEQDLDRTLLEMVHAEDRPWVAAAWRDYVAGRRASYDLEYRCVVGDRPPVLVHVRAAPIATGGALLGFVGIFENISERRRLELQLQQAQKMEAIGQLTGGIAHDFNNVLCSILGYTSLALARHVAPDDRKLAEYLQAVMAAGERARDLVQKMLAFSRSAPGTAPRPCAPATVVREAAQMLASIIPSSIALAVELESDLADVAVDVTDLHQVIVNLVLNARDAVGERGHIGLAVRLARVADVACTACHSKVTGPFVELAVRDDGGGIAPELLQRIFDPFFTTKPVGKGTGMGLSVSHGILHRAGGHVLVEARPGGGTVMRILLPPAGEPAAGTGLPGLAAPEWRRAS